MQGVVEVAGDVKRGLIQAGQADFKGMGSLQGVNESLSELIQSRLQALLFSDLRGVATTNHVNLLCESGHDLSDDQISAIRAMKEPELISLITQKSWFSLSDTSQVKVADILLEKSPTDLVKHIRLF